MVEPQKSYPVGKDRKEEGSGTVDLDESDALTGWFLKKNLWLKSYSVDVVANGVAKSVWSGIPHNLGGTIRNDSGQLQPWQTQGE